MTRLTAVQHRVIQDMIEHVGFILKRIAHSAGYSIHAVANIGQKTNILGASRPPTQHDGTLSLITPEIRHALRKFLSNRPDQYLEEMRTHLHDIFGLLVSISTIIRALKAMHWSKKKNRRRAKEQNEDLRDFLLKDILLAVIDCIPRGSFCLLSSSRQVSFS